jgi:hypothetical protein
MSLDIKKIRQAVCSNRGGWDDASDEDILGLWGTLEPHTRVEYLKSVEDVKNTNRKEKDDANRN